LTAKPEWLGSNAGTRERGPSTGNSLPFFFSIQLYLFLFFFGQVSSTNLVVVVVAHFAVMDRRTAFLLFHENGMRTLRDYYKLRTFPFSTLCCQQQTIGTTPVYLSIAYSGQPSH
jgi:hypothetical protein